MIEASVAESGGRATVAGLLEVRRQDDHDGALRVSLVGELDMAVTAELACRLGSLERLGRPVRLDLSELRFIDGSGVAALVRTMAQARARGCELDVDPTVTEAVERVVSIVGVGRELWPDRGARRPAELTTV